MNVNKHDKSSQSEGIWPKKYTEYLHCTYANISKLDGINYILNLSANAKKKMQLATELIVKSGVQTKNET